MIFYLFLKRIWIIVFSYDLATKNLIEKKGAPTSTAFSRTLLTQLHRKSLFEGSLKGYLRNKKEKEIL